MLTGQVVVLPGQQCYYKDGRLVTHGAAAGTPDLVASAVGKKSKRNSSNADCEYDYDLVIDHIANDVVTFKALTLDMYHVFWVPYGGVRYWHVFNKWDRYDNEIRWFRERVNVATSDR